MDIARKLKCAPPLVYNVRARMAGGTNKKKASKSKVGRPVKAASGSLDGLSGILAAVQSSEKDRQRMRRTLEQIQSVITTALA